MSKTRSAKRARLIAELLQAGQSAERAYARSLAPWFAKLRARILRAVARGESLDVALALGKNEFRALHSNACKRAIFVGRTFEHSWIERLRPPEKTEQFTWPSILVNLRNDALEFLKGWFAARNVGVWQRVSRTIKNLLLRTIGESIKKGENLDQRTRRVQEALGNSKAEARRIARTETVGAMNAGQHSERMNAEVAHKEWVSTIDSKTRTGAFDHAAPDGQITQNNRPFVVSGEHLMFPGDGSLGASPGNLINCRCGGVAAFPTKPIIVVASSFLKSLKPPTWLRIK